jgi:hypothetical protein
MVRAGCGRCVVAGRIPPSNTGWTGAISTVGLRRYASWLLYLPFIPGDEAADRLRVEAW